MQKIKNFSLDIERGGFVFNISCNNLDGGVIIVAQNDIFSYFSIKSFSSAKQASEWINDMVNNARNLGKYINEMR